MLAEVCVERGGDIGSIRKQLGDRGQSTHLFLLGSDNDDASSLCDMLRLLPARYFERREVLCADL